jgi:hypothetical protein
MKKIRCFKYCITELTIKNLTVADGYHGKKQSRCARLLDPKQRS